MSAAGLRLPLYHARTTKPRLSTRQVLADVGPAPGRFLSVRDRVVNGVHGGAEMILRTLLATAVLISQVL